MLSSRLFTARVVKLVDTGDLKSPDHCDRAGSSPAPGTITKALKNTISTRLQQRCFFQNSLLAMGDRDLFAIQHYGVYANALWLFTVFSLLLVGWF